MVELHVPLTTGGVGSDDGRPASWIAEVEEHLFDLEDRGTVEILDDGEEVDDEYLFFLTGRSEKELLSVASGLATCRGVPAGAYAIVTDDESNDVGTGKRVDLPLSSGE